MQSIYTVTIFSNTKSNWNLQYEYDYKGMRSRFIVHSTKRKKLDEENLPDIQKTLMRNIEYHTILSAYLPKESIYIINGYLLIEP